MTRHRPGAAVDVLVRDLTLPDDSGLARRRPPGADTSQRGMPQMDFEVYRNTNTAPSVSNKLKTSQIAFPLAHRQKPPDGVRGHPLQQRHRLQRRSCRDAAGGPVGAGPADTA